MKKLSNVRRRYLTVLIQLMVVILAALINAGSAEPGMTYINQSPPADSEEIRKTIGEAIHGRSDHVMNQGPITHSSSWKCWRFWL